MKHFCALLTVLMLSSVVLLAYEVGGKSKSNFGVQTTAEQDTEQNAATPANNAGRSLTSYGARQNWNKGVQTQTVQTNLAGAQVTEFQPVSPTLQTEQVAKQAGTKTQANAAAANAGKPAVNAQAQKPAQPAAGGADAQTAAAMQQLQGLQNMMQSMGGLMGGAAATGAANNGKGAPAAGSAAQGAATPAGMPDFSSLLNPAGAAGGATAPAGKTK